MHTYQISQSVTQNRARARYPHTTLTSLKFFLLTHASVLQYDSTTRSFSAMKERLGNLLASIDSSIPSHVESLAEYLSYQGETLKIPRGKIAVSTVVSQLNYQSCFLTLNAKPVTMSVFTPSCCPSNLAGFGFDEISLLSSHLSPAFAVHRVFT